MFKLSFILVVLLHNTFRIRSDCHDNNSQSIQDSKTAEIIAKKELAIPNRLVI
jgi:hypothetical protein